MQSELNETFLSDVHHKLICMNKYKTFLLQRIKNLFYFKLGVIKISNSMRMFHFQHCLLLKLIEFLIELNSYKKSYKIKKKIKI